MTGKSILFRTIRRGLGSIETTLDDVSHSPNFTRRAQVLRRDEIGLTAMTFRGGRGGCLADG